MSQNKFLKEIKLTRDCEGATTEAILPYRRDCFVPIAIATRNDARKINISNLLIILLCFAITAPAQTSSLTIDQAIELALKNNYDITISKNQAQQAANNNTPGNAGMLPKVDIIASGSFADNTTKQAFANGLTVDKSGVQSQLTHRSQRVRIN